MPGEVGSPDPFLDAVRLPLWAGGMYRSDPTLPHLPSSSVSPVSENQVASSEGYVLFYQLTQEPPRCL